MLAEYRHMLYRLRWQITGWAAGVVLYSLLMIFFYPNMADMSDMKEYLNMFPETMLAFFKNITVINTPMGYIDVYFFSYMQVIIGIFAVSAGSGLIAADEEKEYLIWFLPSPLVAVPLYFGRLAELRQPCL